MDKTRYIAAITLIITLTCITLINCQQNFNGRNQWDSKRYPGNVIPPWCDPNSPVACWEPPFYPYDEIHRTIDVGKVIGRSMIYQGNPDRYINIFLGVPYARPPIDKLRFQVGLSGKLSHLDVNKKPGKLGHQVYELGHNPSDCCVSALCNL